MPIKIKSASGSVTLSSENVSGDQTLTVPSQASATLQTTADTITSSRLTGALPAISGASLTSLTSGNLTGALPAISGASLTNLPAGGVDGITTASGSGTAINILSNNAVLIGASNPTAQTYTGSLEVESKSGADNGLVCWTSKSSGNQPFIYFRFNTSTTVGSITGYPASCGYFTSPTAGVKGVDANTISIITGDAERARIDSVGTFGIGVDTATWHADYQALQIGKTFSIMNDRNATDNHIVTNAVMGSGGAWTRVVTGASTLMEFNNAGDTRFYTAPSGSAASVFTWDTRFLIKQDGRSVSPFTARAWANFNGTGTVALRDSHNVSSLQDMSTGSYKCNLTTTAAGDKCVIGSLSKHGGGSNSTNSCNMSCAEGNSANEMTCETYQGNGYTLRDSPHVYLACFSNGN
jgi:hypothetical protein